MRRVIVSFAVFCVAAVCQAETIYVDANAPGANNGSSWADAYKYLQDALWAAEPNQGIQIWVAQGTYRPDEDINNPVGTDDRTATFQLKNGVAIYGGFPAGGGGRYPNTYQTILSGDLDEDDEPGFINNGENSYHVVTGSYTNSTAILDGFTITAGNANGSSPYDCGGGMYNESSNPTLANCTFSGNSAKYGAGMYNESSSSPTLDDCTFSGNSADNAAGGMYNSNNSSPTLDDCTFSGNVAKGYSAGSSTTTTTSGGGSTTTTSGGGSTTTTSGGGGMYNNSSSPTLTNCTFSGNYAGCYSGTGTCVSCGGGMYNNSSSPTLTNCTFANNSASGSDIHSSSSGGGMYNNYSNPTLTNCTFRGNSLNGEASTSGGGMKNFYSNPTLTNCSFNDNRAPHFLGNGSGGGIFNGYSSPTVTNCIFWGNYAPNGPEIYNSETSTPIVTFSDVQDGYSGTGNIDADPCFVNSSAGDLRLLPRSPCIDAGDNTAVPEGVETDLDGRDRFADGDCNTTVIVDMGAYEFTYAYLGDFDSDCEVDFTDFAIQAGFWFTDELLVDIAPTPAGDGIVGIYDLAVICDNWLAGK
ncbi:MAG: right-handed parallel beta-helix repeat-containing protein [Sedimentisphaerales bacterium]|nr:right-handed parallel beta-helix repeat-containing protein [Sedimentisphaerales bacterium]